MSDIAEQIKAIITRQLEIKEERVTELANLSDDLGADSLDVIEIVSILEEKFDIDIPDEDGEKIITVKELVSYIEVKTAQQ